MRSIPVRGAILLLAGASVACGGPAHLEWEDERSGARVSVELHTTTQGSAESLLAEIEASLERIELPLGGTEPDSELVELNRRAGDEPYTIQDVELERCVRKAVDWARGTRGAFDPTVGPLMRVHDSAGPDHPPDDEAIAEALERTGWQEVALYPEAKAIRFREPGMELDLDGIREGYYLDVAARNFVRPGARGGLLRYGGSAYAWRAPIGEEFWRVPVADKREPGRVLGTVALSNRALSVSGSLAPLFDPSAPPPRHILDPKTGRPPETDLYAAVVIADVGADADALATALYVLGSQAGASLLDRTIRIEALMVVRGMEGPYLLASASLRDRIELDPEFAGLVGPPRHLLPPTSAP